MDQVMHIPGTLRLPDAKARLRSGAAGHQIAPITAIVGPNDQNIQQAKTMRDATMNRSIAAMPAACVLKKLRQVGEGVPHFRTIYLATVAWLISRPSLSSSPWIRGGTPERIGAAHLTD